MEDSHITVVGNDSKEEDFDSSSEVEKENLGHAAHKRDCLWWGKEEASQHLGGSYRGVTTNQEGEISQQNVHGCVKSGLTDKHHHDEEVSHHCCSINGNEGDEEEWLDSCRSSEAKE